ncbi:TPA: hypothetical protein ENS27_02820, partial [bacterium]|nr:hypothetical protein [bacterium]
SNDILGAGRSLIKEVRKRIFDRTGIKNAMLATTHAHSTPETTGITRLLDVPNADKWLDVLIDQIVTSVELACNDMAEMSLKAGIGEAKGIAKNRRKGNISLDEQRAKGYIDEAVGILLCESSDKSDVLINFSTHPVTVQVQPLVSADYPGVATKLVEDVIKVCRNCAFLQGAAGDINPVRDDTRDFKDVELYGMILGGEAIKIISQLQATNVEPMKPILCAISKVIELPSRDLPDPEPFRQARLNALKEADSAKDDETRSRALKTAGYNQETLKRIERGTDPILAEIQVFRIGDVAIVGIPGEMFVGLGLQIKRESPAPYTFISETTNDWIGYIPTVGTYAEGGYEVHPGPWSMTNEAGGQMIVETAVELVRKLWK